MLRILITGGKGQLGSEFCFYAKEDCQIYAFGSEELNVTNLAEINRLFLEIKPDVVIHCAAYTNVDGCETNQEQAFKVNALGARNVAVASNKIGTKLVYISTDYVFDGSNNRPYQEFDTTNPQSIYGKSKLFGEDLVKHCCSKHFIVRTSWVFGLEGANFVKTIIRIAKENPELKIVTDQVGCPTYAKDLALKVMDLIQTEKYGIYHITNQGSCTWYEFARTILKEMNLSNAVQPISTAELNRPAHRPAFSTLDNYCLKLEGIPLLRSWQEALSEFIEVYKKRLQSEETKL